MPLQSPKPLLLSTAMTGLLMLPASALETQAFLDRVAAVYEKMGYSVEFGAATTNGDAIRVDGATIGILGVGNEPTRLKTERPVEFVGVRERDDGSYFAELLRIPSLGGRFSADPEGSVQINDIRVESMFIPAEANPTALQMLQLMGTLSTGSLTVTHGDKAVVSLFSPAQGSDALAELSASLNLRGLTFHVSDVEQTGGNNLSEMGVETIQGDVNQQLRWSIENGRLSIDEFRFDFADLGALDINLDVEGVTPDLLSRINEMQAQKPAQETASEDEAHSEMIQSLALLEEVSIVGASVRFDDASITDRLLDFYANQSGVDRADFVRGLKAQITGAMGDPGGALSDLVVPEISQFLDDPQSIEVAIAPSSPVGLLLLVAAASDPLSTVRTLGLTVKASQTAK
jgi:hypothetical protein